MENLNCAGIYKITCIVNGKFYIGSSKCISKRFRQHKIDLKANRHTNNYLQNSYNKYGLKGFTFSVLESIQDLDQLLKIEYNYIQQLNPDFNHIREISTVYKNTDLDYCQKVSKASRLKSKTQKAKSTSGYVGIMCKDNAFRAYIYLKDTCIYLGNHLTLDEALKARQEGERIYWSEEYNLLTDADKKIVLEHNALRIKKVNSKSKYKYICFSSSTSYFTVSLRKLGILKTFKTLEEALKFRNSCFSKVPEHIEKLLIDF